MYCPPQKKTSSRSSPLALLSQMGIKSGQQICPEFLSFYFKDWVKVSHATMQRETNVKPATRLLEENDSVVSGWICLVHCFGKPQGSCSTFNICFQVKMQKCNKKYKEPSRGVILLKLEIQKQPILTLILTLNI